MRQFAVTGMSCAACSARVEKAVSKVPGVTSCSVSLLTNSMGVEGEALDKDIIEAVENAGYGASLKTKSKKEKVNNDEELLKDRETPVLKRRLSISILLLIPLMYVSMGHMMWNFPLPHFFDNNYVGIGIFEMLITILIMVINQKFFINGFKSLINRAPNMDALVALGSSASFIWSTYILFKMTKVTATGNNEMAHELMMQFYFESAAMILTLITVGKLLEAKSKGRTTDALKSLMKLAPKTAKVIIDGEEKEILIDEVKKGDVFVVRPGESIPVDGVVVEGDSAVNESALTGESIPIDKKVGDKVSAATINESGFIKCVAERVGEDTTLSKIIQMVSDAAATKAPIAKVADKVSGIFVPTVIIISVVTFIIWMIVGAGVSFSLTRAVAVLVISCPCALGLATPVAIMVGSGVGAKNGILFKTAESLEETGKVKAVVLDKTGTITEGKPKVTDIVVANNIDEKTLLAYAYSLEIKSEHPLAKAIIKKSEEENIKPFDVENFKILPGNGLVANIGKDEIIGGSYKYIKTFAKVDKDIEDSIYKLSEEGKTPLVFVKRNELLGVIFVADTLKPDSKDAIEELKNLGMHVIMLTGDSEKTAHAIGKVAGVDEVVAEVLPDGKDKKIIDIQNKFGKVLMVGDGINDAPALTRADIGIAIGAGTDVAIDAADVVLVKSRLIDVPAAIRLSKKTLTNIHQNLFWAFFYNVIGIPLAAGAYIHSVGLELNPMFAAAAMSLSSFFVVTNALRLNLFDIYKNDNIKNKDNINNKDNMKKETVMGDEKKLEKNIKVEGMMCEHCENRVKKALLKVDGVIDADVSHEKGLAKVTLSKEIEDNIFKDAIEKEEYKVLSVE